MSPNGRMSPSEYYSRVESGMTSREQALHEISERTRQRAESRIEQQESREEEQREKVQEKASAETTAEEQATHDAHEQVRHHAETETEQQESRKEEQETEAKVKAESETQRQERQERETHRRTQQRAENETQRQEEQKEKQENQARNAAESLSRSRSEALHETYERTRQRAGNETQRREEQKRNADEGISGNFWSAIDSVEDSLNSKFSSLRENVENTLGSMENEFSSRLSSLKENVENALGKVESSVKDIYDKLKQKVNGVTEGVSNIFGEIVYGIGHGIITALSTIFPPLQYVSQLFEQVPKVTPEMRQHMEQSSAQHSSVPDVVKEDARQMHNAWTWFLERTVPFGYFMCNTMGPLMGMFPWMRNMTDASLGEQVRQMANSVYQLTLCTPAEYWTAKQRNPDLEEIYNDAMTRLGYSEENRRVFEEAMKAIPTLDDVIRLTMREVFSEEYRQLWPWAFEPPEDAKPWVRNIGMDWDTFKLYWGAHWRQPGYIRQREMYYRRLINADDLARTLRWMDFTSWWQSRLIPNIFMRITRVDIRRMLDMGAIDDAECLKRYEEYGYSRICRHCYDQKRPDIDRKLENKESISDIINGISHHMSGDEIGRCKTCGRLTDAGLMLVWTKVYNERQIWEEKYKAGLIGRDDIKNEAMQFGLTEQGAERITTTVVGIQKPKRTEKERDIKEKQIYETFKKEKNKLDKMKEQGNISEDKYQQEMEALKSKAITALQRLLNLTYYEALDKLKTHTELAGSPETLDELFSYIELYREAQGMEGKELPDEAKRLREQIEEQEKEIDKAIERGVSQERIEQMRADIAPLKARYWKLLQETFPEFRPPEQPSS